MCYNPLLKGSHECNSRYGIHWMKQKNKRKSDPSKCVAPMKRVKIGRIEYHKRGKKKQPRPPEGIGFRNDNSYKYHEMRR